MSDSDRFSPLRILRWHDRITKILGYDKHHPLYETGPIRAAIDLTNLCNDNCPWCEPLQYRKESIADRRHTLETAVVLAVLDDLKSLGCQTINFSGGGEPLLHPDFGTILRYAARKGFTTWIVTNGRYIDKWLDDLRFASHVRISLDASREAEHMEMHGAAAGEFTKTIENIKALCDANHCGPGNYTEVGISYLVADCNSSDCAIRRVTKVAAEAGVDFIHFRPLSEDRPKRFKKEWDKLVPMIEYCSSQEGMEGLTGATIPKTYIVGKRHKDVFNQREFKTCYASLITAVIGANGDCQACCDERTKTYGNVNEQSFRSLWLSAAHRKMAAEIVPALCGRCLMCSVNKSVQDFVLENKALPELV